MQIQFRPGTLQPFVFTAALVANAATVNWKIALFYRWYTIYKPVANNNESWFINWSNGLATSVDFWIAGEVADKEMVYIRFTGTGDEVLNDNNGEYNFDKVDSEEVVWIIPTMVETGLGVFMYLALGCWGRSWGTCYQTIAPADKTTGVCQW